MRPCCGRYTPLITFSIELLPAPLGPMMARTSCSRTSKDTSVNAFTPPKASDTPSTASTTSPIARPAAVVARSFRFMPPAFSCRRLRGQGREGLRRVHAELGAHEAGAAVLEAHLRLDHAALHARVEGVHDGGVLLADEAAAHLARARELAVVGVELLVQDHEAVDLAPRELGIVRQVGVHLPDAVADQLDHLRLGGEVGVARVGDAAALGPVTHRL